MADQTRFITPAGLATIRAEYDMLFGTRDAIEIVHCEPLRPFSSERLKFNS